MPSAACHPRTHAPVEVSRGLRRAMTNPIHSPMDCTRTPHGGRGAMIVHPGGAVVLWGVGTNDQNHTTCTSTEPGRRPSVSSRRTTHPANARVGRRGRACKSKLATLPVQFSTVRIVYKNPSYKNIGYSLAHLTKNMVQASACYSNNLS